MERALQVDELPGVGQPRGYYFSWDIRTQGRSRENAALFYLMRNYMMQMLFLLSLPAIFLLTPFSPTSYLCPLSQNAFHRSFSAGFGHAHGIGAIE
jgi:hypothetical protein